MSMDRVICIIKNKAIKTAVVFITAVFLLSCGQAEMTANEPLTGIEETVSGQVLNEISDNVYIQNQNATEEIVYDRILTKVNESEFGKAQIDRKESVSGEILTKYHITDNFQSETDKMAADIEKAADAETAGLLVTMDLDSLRQNLPVWVKLSQKKISDEGTINIQLTEGELKVKQGSELIWESGDFILVQDFLWCDIDGDEGNELLLLCWKQGKYGKHRPFWVEENDTEISQHIFIYDWDGEQISQLWLASDIGMEITQWIFDEHGFLMVQATEGKTSGWAWISWGLQLVDTSVTFAAVGDDLIHMQIVGCGRQKGNYDFMFEHIKNRVQQADIAVINQETMFVDNPAQYSGYPRFGSPAAIGDAIKNAGFDVVTCGTNHSMDKGMEGINTTYRKLRDMELVVLGIHGEELSDNGKNYSENMSVSGNLYSTYDDLSVSENAYSGMSVSANLQNKDSEIMVADNAENTDGKMPLFINSENNGSERILSENVINDGKPYEIITKKRIRFAMLNYTYGTNGLPVPQSHPNAVNLLADEERVREELRLAREDADIVIAFVHWGTEYQKQPDAFQEKWTEVFLQEGVDVVVGTHPHVMQPVQMLQREDGHEMLVYYSLGNFISAQDSIETVLGGFAEFTISITMDGCKITAYDMLPMVTHQQKGEYTTYFLEDYTEELAQKHRLSSKGLTVLRLQEVSKNIKPE